MQFFAENNVIGLYEEGNYTAWESDGEFAELRCYLLAKLMWDPYCNIDRHMYDFCKAYYGKGAQGIIDFINYIDENSGGISVDLEPWWITPIPNNIYIRNGLTIYAPVTSQTTLRMKKSDVEKVDAMWQAAKDGAETAEQLDNVLRSELCWRYWKACARVGEFDVKNAEDVKAVNQKLYDDFKTFGIKRLSEGNGGYIKENPDMLVSPNKWK